MPSGRARRPTPGARLQPRPFPLYPRAALQPPSPPPSSPASPVCSAQGLSEPLMGPEEEWESVVEPSRPYGQGWRPALSWAAGAVGCALVQASVAVAARPDAGVAQLSSAATAMAAGTWLYIEGVKKTLGTVVEGDGGAWPRATLAAGSYVSAIVGVGLATVPVGPVRMAGIGLDVLASQGFHTSLTDTFIRSERQRGRHESLRDDGSPVLDRLAGSILLLAAASGAGSVAAIALVPQLGTAEAAGAALFCHALCSSSVAAFLGLRSWRRQQEALSPRRGWQSP